MMYAPETENSNAGSSAVQMSAAADMPRLLRDGAFLAAQAEYPHWDAYQIKAYSVGALSYWICQAISEDRHDRELAKKAVMNLIRKGMEAHK